MMAAKRHKEHRLENGCRNGVGGSRSFSMPRFYLLTTAIVMPSLTWAADDLPRKYCLLLDRPKLAELQNIGSDLELPDLEITFEKYSRVDRSGWTWVSGGWDGTTHQRGYMVSPDGKFRHDMPEVFQEDCSYGSWLSGRCRPSLSTFSPAARVAFIAGSLRTANGDSAPKSYAIFGSTEVELPTNARGKTKHVGVIPELGLSILSGPSNALILFSSEIVAIYDLSLLNAANDQPVNWRSISTYDNRTLIVGGEFVLNHAIFVYEILPGPSLKAIPVPIRRGGDFTVRFLELPMDPQLWAVAENSLWAEWDGEFHETLSFSKKIDAAYLTQSGIIQLSIESSSDLISSYVDLEPTESDCNGMIVSPGSHQKTIVVQ